MEGQQFDVCGVGSMMMYFGGNWMDSQTELSLVVAVVQLVPS